MTNILWYPCCQIWTGPTPVAMLLIYTLNRNTLCRVEVQLIFKNVRRNKKVYTKCKSEEITEAESAPRNRS